MSAPQPDAGPGDRLTRKPGLAVVDGERRAVILDLDRPAHPPLALDGSGRAVWDALEQPRTATEVVGVVADLYGEPVETVEPAVRAFVDELIARGLVVGGNSGAEVAP